LEPLQYNVTIHLFDKAIAYYSPSSNTQEAHQKMR